MSIHAHANANANAITIMKLKTQTKTTTTTTTMGSKVDDVHVISIKAKISREISRAGKRGFWILVVLGCIV
jgi:hypothetical protein